MGVDMLLSDGEVVWPMRGDCVNHEHRDFRVTRDEPEQVLLTAWADEYGIEVIHGKYKVDVNSYVTEQLDNEKQTFLKEINLRLAMRKQTKLIAQRRYRARIKCEGGARLLHYKAKKALHARRYKGRIWHRSDPRKV